MVHLKYIVVEKERKILEKNLKRRGITDINLEALVKLNMQVSEMEQELGQLQEQKNTAAKIKDVKLGAAIKEKSSKLIEALRPLQAQLFAAQDAIPNILMDDVPDGGEGDGKILRTVGDKPLIDKPKDHIQLGTDLNILDIERATKTSGSRFYFLKNQAVELEFAIVRWVMDLLKSRGFELMVPPVLINEKIMNAGGYLGKAADEVYRVQDDLYLVGTSEQAMLGYHALEIVDVPKRYAAFSTCFRREAGSYGKDVKGMIRTHQFDKVEMFAYVTPPDSAQEQEALLAIQEEIMRGLEIPYRVVLLAAEDTSSFASARTIDIESWIPSQDRYRETHSVSNCTDWQAEKAGIRYEKGKLVHTLNGTAIAIGRTLVAMWENHQRSDGSIKIPKALHPYLSFKEIK